jgi:hypothetical protein
VQLGSFPWRTFVNADLAVIGGYMIASSIGRTFASVCMALLCTLTFSVAPSGVTRTALAQSGSLIGTWALAWEGARDNYTGTLRIATKVSDRLFKGKLHLVKSNGQQIDEDASITVDGKDVRIECSQPSVKPWVPDRFYVVRDDNRMVGYSLDASGQRGKQIVFTLR